MKTEAARPAIVTPEHKKEAERLMQLWLTRAHPPQAEFGETYEIGNQSAVSGFLRGRTPLSMKAALGFAKGLACEISDFSPRLAAEAATIASSVPTGQLSPAVDKVAKEIDAFPERQRRELIKIVRKLIRAERRAPPPPAIPQTGEEGIHSRRHSSR